MHGQEYHPPSRKRQTSRSVHKGVVDINEKLDSLCDVMQEQQNKIARLKKEKQSAKLKLKMLTKNAETKQSKSKPLVTAQPTNNSSSDSDVQEVVEKLDCSTQPKPVEGMESGLEDLTSAQLTQKKKRKTRAHIDSISTTDQTYEKRDAETEDDADVLTDLRQKKADLEEKCSEMERRLMEQRMDNQF